ncbi:MAG TPA: hypothetical protein VK963_04710 [Candidatus Saccharimonadales bacterium]|nr:hypothetical protein [Candidatus Saccharimonadales bacterium]
MQIAGDQTMEQNRLPLTQSEHEGWSKMEPSAGVVAIDREDDRDIILRFLSKSVAWGEPRMVRIDVGLAEQLRRLLHDELEEAGE